MKMMTKKVWALQRNSWLNQGLRMAHSLIYFNQFSCFFGEMWFLTAGPVVGIPMILAELPKRKNCGSSRSITVTNKSNSPTCNVDSSLVCTSPLVVITVDILDVLVVSYSAESRSRLLTMCMLAPESTTYSLSSGSFVDAAGSTHSSAGE